MGPCELAQPPELVPPSQRRHRNRDRVSRGSTQKPESGPGNGEGGAGQQPRPQDTPGHAPHLTPGDQGWEKPPGLATSSQTLPPHWEGSVPRAWPGPLELGEPHLAQQEAEKM